MRSSYSENQSLVKPETADIHPFLSLQIQGPPTVTAVKPEPVYIQPKKKKTEEKTEEENRENQAAKVSEQILEEAREQAAVILKDARKEAEAIRKKSHMDGYREGFEEGKKDGLSEGKEEYGQAIEKVESETADAVREIEEAKKGLLKKYLGTLRDISLAVAEKVIQVSLGSSSEIILRMIAAEAEKHRKTAWIKIYIDKEDYDMVIKTENDIAEALSNFSENIKFVVMDKEPRGYLIMETPEEIIDMSVKTQVDNVKSKLKEVPIEDEDIDVQSDS
ncbi:MAG: FliH/SctL family protein [Lachnospiraceae bacterium]|jgi:flagellar assembly protein FliH|nr:FliH/SctL family protein [Lachnospiraceae bacterium]